MPNLYRNESCLAKVNAQRNLAEYERATASAYAEYERARAPAYAEFERATASAWDEFERATAPAFFDASQMEG